MLCFPLKSQCSLLKCHSEAFNTVCYLTLFQLIQLGVTMWGHSDPSVLDLDTDACPAQPLAPINGFLNAGEKICKKNTDSKEINPCCLWPFITVKGCEILVRLSEWITNSSMSLCFSAQSHTLTFSLNQSSPSFIPLLASSSSSSALIRRIQSQNSPGFRTKNLQNEVFQKHSLQIKRAEDMAAGKVAKREIRR